MFSDPFSNDVKATQASEMMKKHRRENTEHSNPYSYSWNVIRLAVMKLSQHQLQEFIGIAGIEMQGTVWISVRFLCNFVILLFSLQNFPLLVLLFMAFFVHSLLGKI